MPVELGEHSYEVMVGRGLLTRIAETLSTRCPASHYAVIADSSVAPRYAEPVRAALAQAARVTLLTFPAGEPHKNRETWSTLTDQLLAAGLGRDGALVALGGGVTGDLVGFVAATYLRGIPYVQLPTTLLAMVDSSVGGKTGVDTSFGKNLIGAFHQPRVVVADVATLESLPRPHLVAGLAEVLKHAFIADSEELDRLLLARDQILRGNLDDLAGVISRSVGLKARVVAADEREQGRRAILNFGHTVAHAVEAVSGYSLIHGEAVAIGMALECEIGRRMGVTGATAAERVRSAIRSFELPDALAPGIAADRLIEAMASDKKVRDRTIRFALLKDIGEPARGPAGEWTLAAPIDVVRAVLTGGKK